jgi:calcium-dependent protein kinase
LFQTLYAYRKEQRLINRLYSPPLGKGAQGEVRKALHYKTKEARAIKAISKNDMNQNHFIQTLTEISILKKVDHPNVVKIYEFFESTNYFHIVMEMCDGKRLFNKIIDLGGVSERRTADILFQLISALRYLHNHGIVHRDIKSENIMYNGKVAKIIDFGTSRFFDPLKHMGELKGTVYYVAPEVITKKYNEKCDIWSAGILLFILLTGSPPFVGDRDQEIFNNILKENYCIDIDTVEDISEESKDIVKQMLIYDHEKRPSAEYLLKHPWFGIMKKSTDTGRSLKNMLYNLETFTTKNKLQEGIFYYFINNMVTKKEHAELAETFKVLDIDGDGVLTRDELREGFKKLNKMYSDEEINEMFQLIDTDGSGTISYTEYVAAAIEKEKLLSDERLETVFKIFDEDKSGKISVDEFQKIFEKANYIENDELIELIKESDLNDDGEIDWMEFRGLMRKMIVKVTPNFQEKQKWNTLQSNGRTSSRRMTINKY